MSDVITRLMEANLLDVFNERDRQRRWEAIVRTYAANVQWIDDEGLTSGHDALNSKASRLQETLHGLHFIKAGAVRKTCGLGFLAWKLCDSDGQAVASGFDVAEISDDLILRFWTVLDPPE